MPRKITQSKLGIINLFFEVALFALLFVFLPIFIKFSQGQTTLFNIAVPYFGSLLIYFYFRFRKIEVLQISYLNDIYKSVIWLIFGFMVVVGIEYILPMAIISSLKFLLILFYEIALLIIAKSIFSIIKFRFFSNALSRVKVLIIGVNRHTQKVVEIFNNIRNGSEVVGILDNVVKADTEIGSAKVLGKINTFEEVIKEKNIDLIVQVADTEHTTTIMTIAEYYRVRFLIISNILGIPSKYITSANINNYLFIEPRGTLLSGWAQIFKRVFDFVFSLVLLIVLSPIFLLIIIAVKLSDIGAPIFVGQTRVDGRNGKEFTMWRFRTLLRDVQEPEPTAQNFRDFPKLVRENINKSNSTKFGKFLRVTHLMDLTQLWNVLRGEMGIVGPRPPFAVEYENYDWLERKRLLIKPGITGLWQIERKEYTFDKMVELDIKYVENWSFWYDGQIILKTFVKFILGRI